MWSCYLQSLLLQIGEAMLEEEAQEAAKEKSKYMKEQCPTISGRGSMQELQVDVRLWFTFKKSHYQCLLTMITVSVYPESEISIQIHLCLRKCVF